MKPRDNGFVDPMASYHSLDLRPDWPRPGGSGFFKVYLKPTDWEVDSMESWNVLQLNRSCLHWGQSNGPDHNKHRVLDTNINNISTPVGHIYGFAWVDNIMRMI